MHLTGRSFLRHLASRRYRTTPSALPSPAIVYPLSLQIQGPDDSRTVQRTFASPNALSIWVNSYKRAVLKALATSSQSELILSRSDYTRLDPSRVYSIHSPLHPELLDDIRHNQMADKAFEAKCRLALERYLSRNGKSITECRHDLTAPGTIDTTIKWDGLFKDPEGVHYLLECKHVMSLVVPLQLFLVYQ